MGRETDAVALFAELAAAPYRHDFYQTLRRLECLFDDKPRWGLAKKPDQEQIRLGQAPDVSFAPAPLASFTDRTDREPPRLHIQLFGLLGPNGPLPLHLTEYARERMRHGDATFSRFLDVLQHRFITLFYRAWAQAQPHVNRDRPETDRFAAYTGAFVGVAPESLRGRDSVPDLAKFFHAGTFVRGMRNADGLQAVLEHFFQVPVRVQEFVGHWMDLGPGERSYLSHEGTILGAGAVLGGSVWDRQHKFRIKVGSLTLAEYEAFLPGGALMPQLVDWVRLYLNLELEWDVRMVLRQNEVPPLVLGRAGRLGWTTWLGRRPEATDADDLCLDAEAFANRAGVRAA